MTKQIRRSNDHFACKKKIKMTKINNISKAKKNTRENSIPTL